MSVASQTFKPNLGSILNKAFVLFEAETIENDLMEALSSSDGTIREMCSHIASAGGKRIRPLLVLYCGLLFQGPSELLAKAAVAAELIHMATLVHDDIIDKSQMRRGKPTLNKVWGNHSSVLCGDFLFAKAFEILSQHKLYKSLALMVEAIDCMCNGEIKQDENKFNINMTLETYYRQITNKTAKFLECCCKSGASAANVDESLITAAGKYGLNLGLAFQIMDDILDYKGNEAVMGKEKGGDLRQGIITLPVILLQKNNRFRTVVNDILNKKDVSESDYSLITGLLEITGSLEQSHKIALSHIDEALLHLQQLPDSPYRGVLENLAEALRYRQS